MSDKKYDVFGVGNALVDVLAQVEDELDVVAKELTSEDNDD